MSKQEPKQVAVIGAGMGGLSAAIELANAGQQVTLYEANHCTGGKLHTLEVAGHAIDSGPTVFTMRWIFDALFASTNRSLEDYVPLERAERLSRHCWLDGSVLDLYADIEASCAAIQAFSNRREADGYRTFVADASRIFDTLDKSFMRTARPGPLQLTRNVGFLRVGDLLATKPFVSLWKELTRRFQDQRLAQLFARYATYCGSNPFLAPATLMLIAEAERRGVWYVRGGMIQLARGLSRCFEELGGQLRLNCTVKELLPIKSGGFQVTDSTGETDRYSAVVFNGDSQALAESLLGSSASKATPIRNAQAFSLSAVTLSLVGRVQGQPLAHHTVCFSDDYRAEFDMLWNQRRLPETPTIYLCTPATQEAERPVFVLANAPPEVFSQQELWAYRERILATLERHNVHINFVEEHCVTRSPTDFAERFPASRGALYGRPTHGFAGSFTRPGSATRLSGLFLAGGSVHPGAGIPMATQSGRVAAEATLNYLKRS